MAQVRSRSFGSQGLLAWHVSHTCRAGTLALALIAGTVVQVMSVSAEAQTVTPAAPKRPTRGLPDPDKPLAPVQPPATPGAPAAPGSTPATPATPGMPAATPETKKEPTWGPIVTRERERDLLFQVRMHLHFNSVGYSCGKTFTVVKPDPFEFLTMGVVWPVLRESASSITFRGDMRGTLKINDKIADDTPTILPNYPGGIMLARLDAGDNQKPTYLRQLDLEMEIPVRCFRTVFDEAAAMKMPWPARWPEQATSIMAPQLFLETGIDTDGKVKPFEAKPIADALQTWLRQERISDARDVPPAMLAKIITGKVWRDIALNNEQFLTFKRTGEVSGFNVRPASATLLEGRGNQLDLAITLATVLRHAGLPTRLVIGHDNSGGGGKFLKGDSKSARPIAWVEFCLFDDKANTVNWVPVDIGRLKKSSSRPADIARPWKYFGTHDEMDRIVPFAFHLHPPTDVVAYGSPGIWGWFVTPAPPAMAEQSLSFTTTTRSTRGGEAKPDPNEK
jgi:transglutaminase-like putative cysteine protease